MFAAVWWSRDMQVNDFFLIIIIYLDYLLLFYVFISNFLHFY